MFHLGLWQFHWSRNSQQLSIELDILDTNLLHQLLGGYLLCEVITTTHQAVCIKTLPTDLEFPESFQIKKHKYQISCCISSFFGSKTLGMEECSKPARSPRVPSTNVEGPVDESTDIAERWDYLNSFRSPDSSCHFGMKFSYLTKSRGLLWLWLRHFTYLKSLAKRWLNCNSSHTSKGKNIVQTFIGAYYITCRRGKKEWLRSKR